MKRYIQNNPVIQAMKYTGENDAEIVEWIKTFNKVVFVSEADFNYLTIVMDRIPLVCKLDEYVIKINGNSQKYKGDTAVVMTESQFFNIYKEFDVTEPRVSLISPIDRAKVLKEDVITNETIKAENYHFKNGRVFAKIIKEGEDYKIQNGKDKFKKMFSIKDYNDGTIFITRYYDKEFTNSGDAVNIHIPKNQRESSS